MNKQSLSGLHSAPLSNDDTARFLEMVGSRVLQHRTNAGLSRRVLSEMSSVSPRYLAQLESGQGNISIGLLNRISIALGCDVGDLVSNANTRAGCTKGRAHRIALIGLRGAGKSTLGRLVAEKNRWPFIELNEEIQTAGGIPVNEVFSLYGEDGYRRLERQALEKITEQNDQLILAVAGGIVEDRRTFDYLLDHYQTIWLRTTPEDHMRRVRGQGDMRPMAGNPDAMSDLRHILTIREALYSRASKTLNTTGSTQIESLTELMQIIETLTDQKLNRPCKCQNI